MLRLIADKYVRLCCVNPDSTDFNPFPLPKISIIVSEKTSCQQNIFLVFPKIHHNWIYVTDRTLLAATKEHLLQNVLFAVCYLQSYPLSTVNTRYHVMSFSDSSFFIPKFRPITSFVYPFRSFFTYFLACFVVIIGGRMPLVGFKRVELLIICSESALLWFQWVKMDS